MKIIDDFLAGIDFNLQFLIHEVSIEITGNKSSDKYGNKKLMNFGCEQQRYRVTKNNDEMKVNICGWNFGTHDKFTELYLFLIKSKNTIT